MAIFQGYIFSMVTPSFGTRNTESEEALLLDYNFHSQLLNLLPFITKNDFGKKSCNSRSREWAFAFYQNSL